MLAGFARQFNSLSLPKAGYHLGLTSLLLLMGAGSVHDATALNETRTLSFHHTHSDEDLTITFKRDGRYDEEALKQLNHYLRDWRSQDETVMDRHLFDILWEVYRDVDGKAPIQIISSYRSPATNAMLRRRSSGVARFSQHMLGHAMDFFIPGVPLEQIRYAGLRLQRGGVGFYPTSGSPFVHLDTGSIRHWPRMTHDQLAKVFPDGRTVHVPTDGVPLKGYELAKAEIEKRGDDAATIGKTGFFASLFRGKSSEDDDEAGGPAVNDKPAPAAKSSDTKTADNKTADTKASDTKASDTKASDTKASDTKASDTKASDTKSADPVPMPRAKPQVAAAFQLASADAQVAEPARPKQPVAAPSEQKPETPADIINARGFWGDTTAAPTQASPAQVAAIRARQAVAAADPQATASVPAAYQALAYAPAAASPVDRNNIVAASAPIPRSIRPAPRNAAAATEIDTVAAKSPQGQGIATSTRLSAAKGDDTWMRIMMLAPSATTMSVTTLGDVDMTQMRGFFVKPQTAIAMSFSDDPMLGMSCDRFSGSAITTLETTSFVLRTAALMR